MWENLVVGAVVACSVVWIVRYLRRELGCGGGKAAAGGCDCPLSGHCRGSATAAKAPHGRDAAVAAQRVRTRGSKLTTILFTACTASAVTAVAADATTEAATRTQVKASSAAKLDELALSDDSEPWWQRDHAVSSRLRERLAAAGLKFDVQVTSEVFSCANGGNHAEGDTAVRGLVDLALELDLEQVAGWSGATVGLLAQHASGNGISDRVVGDRQVISNIDAHDFTQISELWLVAPLSSRTQVKLGKLDANTDLAAIDHGEDFLNSSFGLIPTVPLPTYPYPGLGAVVLADASSRLSMAAGVFDGTPDLTDSGLAFSLGGHSVSAIGVRYRGLTRTAAGDGVYRAGVWFHSASLPELGPKSSGRDASGNYGAWFSVDQPLLAAVDGRRLGAFVQLGWAPSDRNELSGYVGCGLALRAPFAARPDDGAGLGIAHARLSHHIRHRHNRGEETTIELYYRAQLLPWLAVQPDVQYIVAPDGRGDDSLAIGLRMHTSL